MINRIIEFSARNRVLVFAVTAILCIAGWWSMHRLALDALPDLSDTQVIVMSRWDRSPDVIEDQVTYPIVSALVGAPKLLLVDEPSEGLAPMVVSEIFESLARMRSEGVALLLVEQNVRRAAAISSSCYVMEKGRIIKHGTPADVMADEAIRQRLSV